MEILGILTVLILSYQVTLMPQIDNSKYTFAVQSSDVPILRMDTQNGSVEKCYKGICTPLDLPTPLPKEKND
jgi:hypothetical protein